MRMMIIMITTTTNSTTYCTCMYLGMSGNTIAPMYTYMMYVMTATISANECVSLHIIILFTVITHISRIVYHC